MKMLNKLVSLLSIVALASILSACNGTLPTQEEFGQLSPKSREAAETKAMQHATVLAQYWDAVGVHLYKANQPVRMGTKATGYTMQWQVLPGDYDAVSFYPGHNPPGLSGAVTEGMYTAVADKKGNIIYFEDKKKGIISPNKLLANVAETEDILKTLVKVGAQVVSAPLVGALGSHLIAEGNCGNDCGDLTLISSSDGVVTGTASADANVGLPPKH